MKYLTVQGGGRRLRSWRAANTASLASASLLGAAKVAKFDVLELLPSTFVRIDIRCVRRQPYQMNTFHSPVVARAPNTTKWLGWPANAEHASGQRIKVRLINQRKRSSFQWLRPFFEVSLTPCGNRRLVALGCPLHRQLRRPVQARQRPRRH